MIEWWGPIIFEYYGATEGMGSTMITSRGVARAPGFGRPGVQLRRCTSSTRRATSCPTGETGVVWFEPGDRAHELRVPQGPGQDGGHARRPDGWIIGRRHGLPRRRRLPLPHRPARLHDRVGRREHLPAGGREPAHHPPEGDGRGGVRRAQRGDGRGGQGRRPADRPGDAGPELERELLAFCREQPRALQVPACRSTSRPSCPRQPTGKLYKRLLRDRYWTGKQSRIV